MTLIPRPDLTVQDEELLAAQAIAQTTGALSVEQIDKYLANFKELRSIVENGGLMPICPELTNANPSAPHTVILETQAWLLAQMAYRINQVPEQNFIEFARLFGIEIREATKAQTILRFTTAQAIGNVTVPSGTRVSTEDGNVVFETTANLTIVHPATTGTVAARNLVVGHTLVASNKLTKILDNIAFIGAATNLNAIDSGTDAESLESTLDRVKRYQRRGERIVSTKDLEEAILEEALEGNGVVRAFPFVKNGEFQEEDSNRKIEVPGHTTVIVMTANGENIDSLMMAKIGAVLNQCIGNQFIYVVNPQFVEFNVSVNVKLTVGTPQGAVLTAIENNLRSFYAASREQFGRKIYRSEIIAVIEGTNGVDRIEPLNSTQILISPASDVRLEEFELAKLVEVNINAV